MEWHSIRCKENIKVVKVLDNLATKEFFVYKIKRKSRKLENIKKRNKFVILKKY